jgi:WD40 repeat protein
MHRNTQILTLITVLASLAITACVPPSSSRGTVTDPPAMVVVDATQEPVTPLPGKTATPEPQITKTPTHQPVTPTASIEAAKCTEPVDIISVGEIFSYKHVQFTVYQSLGFNFTVQECQAGVLDEGWNPYYPAHLVFKSTSTLPNHHIQPEIRVFEIPEDPQSYTYPLNSLDDLHQVLEERTEPSPWFNGVALHTGEQYLDSHYGLGVRAVVEYFQDPYFWINNYLQYVYHGLTDDGRYFIIASFPLQAPNLMDLQNADPRTNTNPDAIPIPGWPADYAQQDKIVEAYNQEVLRQFEATYFADLRPELGVYDFLVESIQVGVPSPAVSTWEAVCFTPPAEVILPFSFTPDSSSLLLQGNDWVQIFDLETQKEISIFRAPKNIMTAALSPDGETLAWSLDDHTIQLLRVADQKVLHTLKGHTDMVIKLRFSPAGDLLVSASHDDSVRIWNTQGEELRSFEPLGEVLGIGLSPDGKILATVPFDGPVSLWNLETLEKVADLGGHGGYTTSDPYFSPDGQLLAADLASDLSVWKISNGQQIWNEGLNSMAVVFSPDGRYLAYTDIHDNNKVFLSSSDGSEIVRYMEGHQCPIMEIFFSPDSELLVSADGLREIRIWRVEDGSLQYIGKAACP